MAGIEVFKVIVPFSDCGEISQCDGIEYRGKVWLVPEWLEAPALGVKKPVRIVHLGLLGLKPTQFAGCRYMADVMLIAKSVLLGQTPPQPPIEVVESPDISIQIPVGSDRLH
jgi:hypothetical protein